MATHLVTGMMSEEAKALRQQVRDETHYDRWSPPKPATDDAIAVVAEALATKVRAAAADRNGDIWWPIAAQFIDGAWRADFGYEWRTFEPQPTHWMPIPAPPVAS